MKRYIIAALAIFAFGFTATAQMRTAYFMEGSTFRTDMNAALAPTRGYVNFPFIGNIGVNLNNNFLSVSNLFYPNPNGEGMVTFLHESVDKNKFLSKLPAKNNLSTDISLNLIGFGAHTKRFFWNTGINLKASTDITIPKQFFTLLTTLGQGSYDMSGLHAGLSSHLELYIGAAVPIGKHVTIGARLKGLAGLASADITIDKMTADITDEFVDARLHGTLQANTFATRRVSAGEEIEFDHLFDFNSLSFRNGGAAIDFGAEFRLFKDHLRISAGVNDLGFIKWHKNSTITGEASAGFRYEGYDFDKDEFVTDSDDFVMQATESAGGYTKRLNTSLNVGLEYAMLRNRISIGLLSHTRFGTASTQTELTLSANFKPVNWLTASVSHTFLNRNALGVMGFALNIHPKGLNLFLGADFVDFKRAKSESLPLPVNLKSANLYFGFGFSLGRAKYSQAYKDDVAAGRVKVKK